MAEDTGELWKHIGDLHRKHSELAIQMHEKSGGGQDGGMQEMHSAVTELTASIKELITVMKGDVQADKGETKTDKGEVKAEKSENGTGKPKRQP